MSRASPGQMKKLLELLSEDGTLKSGKVVYTASLNRQEFWRRIAMQLNALDGGVYKNTWKWCKMWADWKNKTKKKANILLRKTYSLDEPKPALTTLEFRLLKLIGYPMDRAVTIELAPIQKMEDLEDPIDEEREFFAADIKTQSDQEDNTAIQFLVGSTLNDEFASAEKLLRKGHAEYLDEASGNEKSYSSKTKGKKYRKKRRLEEASGTGAGSGAGEAAPLEQYKLRTSLALEREKLRQRDEELRLRALELKLKGDELRLKEAEMNKINFLTNVEEEKLKCFRDVAALLKELVERTKNGNPNPPRFHNII